MNNDNSDKNIKFNISIFNFLPFFILSLFLFFIVMIIQDVNIPTDAKIGISIFLFFFGVFWAVVTLTIRNNILIEDINILRFIYAKIKYVFFRYILGKKSYLFKYKKYDSFRDIFSIPEIKKEKTQKFQARQFLRYIKNIYKKPVFANKFCIVHIDYGEKQISYFDKLSQTGFKNNEKEHPIDEKILKKIYNKLCQTFDFDTTTEDVIEIIKSNLYISFQYLDSPVNFNNMNLNNMSVAELLSLPGMNLGKANKIYSHRQSKHYFTNVDEFIKIAEINDENAVQIRKLFGAGFNCDIKKLNEIKAKEK